MADKNEKKTAQIFCANDQQETEHAASVDGNGDYVFTCDCGRFVKVPGDTHDLKEYFANHKDANEGQVSTEKMEQDMQEKLDKI